MRDLNNNDIKIVLDHLRLKAGGSFTDIAEDNGHISGYIAAANSLFGTNAKESKNLHALSEEIFEEWSKSGFHMYFSTSGSTGIAKKIMFPKERYDSECESMAKIFKGIKRIVSFAPTYHSYGFTMGVALPVKLGVPVVHLNPLLTADSLSHILSGDAVIAFPIFWAAFAALNTQKKEIMGVSSTGPLGETLFRDLLQNHVADMVEIYGASELGVVSYRHSPDDSFLLLDKFTRASVESEILDNVEWDSDSTFRLFGRIDKAVQVAGINVYPEKINAIILNHPAVEGSVVRLMKPSEGNRLKAFVVLKDKTADNKKVLKEIKLLLDSQGFSSAETVKSFVFGRCLPVNDMGKTSDWDIRKEGDYE